MHATHTFSDASFLVQGRTVHAHKFILFARSDYFRRMFYL